MIPPRISIARMQAGSLSCQRRPADHGANQCAGFGNAAAVESSGSDAERLRDELVRKAKPVLAAHGIFKRNITCGRFDQMYSRYCSSSGLRGAKGM